MGWPLQIARMSHQYKLGDGSHNNRPIDAWIKLAKSWMAYLPQLFHDKFIASLFMEINEERAGRVLRKYHNKHLRINPMDSAAPKGFVGWNNRQYVRLTIALHYFVGMRILSPVNAIYLLRGAKIKRDYTALLRTVVDMTRVTHNGKASIVRAIKVGVITV